MRRILGTESPPRSCFAHTAILLWRTRTVTPNCIQPADRERSESQKGRSDFSSVFSILKCRTNRSDIKDDQKR